MERIRRHDTHSPSRVHAPQQVCRRRSTSLRVISVLLLPETHLRLMLLRPLARHATPMNTKKPSPSHDFMVKCTGEKRTLMTTQMQMNPTIRLTLGPP